MFLFLTSITSLITFYHNPDCSHCHDQLTQIKSKNLNINIEKSDDCTFVYGKFKSKYLTNIMEYLVPKLSNYESKRHILKPTVVYFYNKIDIQVMDLLQRLSLDYPLVNFVRIWNEHDSIVGYNGDLVRKYIYTLTYESLKGWLEVMFSKMQILPLNYHLDSTFFVVFYRDMRLVPQFLNIHHKNRFLFKMYKSDNNDLMHHLNISIREDELVLGLYKARVWHKLKIKRFNERVIEEWMRNAYYPHVTVINDSNMESIFHGHKPTILMILNKDNDKDENKGNFSIDQNQDAKNDNLNSNDKSTDSKTTNDNTNTNSKTTTNDKSIENTIDNDMSFGSLLDRFEKLSIKLHDNKAFIDYTFAVLTDDHKDLIDRILPNIPIPNLLMYDPIKMLYYYDTVDIKNMEMNVDRLIVKYRSNELGLWPPIKKRNRMWYGIGVIVVIGMYLGTRQAKKYKIH